MPIDQELNIRLKEIWALDEKMAKGEQLTEDERIFYNLNLNVIQAYYQRMSEYWSKKDLVLSL